MRRSDAWQAACRSAPTPCQPQRRCCLHCQPAAVLYCATGRQDQPSRTKTFSRTTTQPSYCTALPFDACFPCPLALPYTSRQRHRAFAGQRAERIWAEETHGDERAAAGEHQCCRQLAGSWAKHVRAGQGLGVECAPHTLFALRLVSLALPCCLALLKLPCRARAAPLSIRRTSFCTSLVPCSTWLACWWWWPPAAWRLGRCSTALARWVVRVLGGWGWWVGALATGGLRGWTSSRWLEPCQRGCKCVLRWCCSSCQEAPYSDRQSARLGSTARSTPDPAAGHAAAGGEQCAAGSAGQLLLQVRNLRALACCWRSGWLRGLPAANVSVPRHCPPTACRFPPPCFAGMQIPS